MSSASVPPSSYPPHSIHKVNEVDADSSQVDPQSENVSPNVRRPFRPAKEESASGVLLTMVTDVRREGGRAPSGFHVTSDPHPQTPTTETLTSVVETPSHHSQTAYPESPSPASSCGRTEVGYRLWGELSEVMWSAAEFDDLEFESMHNTTKEMDWQPVSDRLEAIQVASKYHIASILNRLSEVALFVASHCSNLRSGISRQALQTAGYLAMRIGPHLSAVGMTGSYSTLLQNAFPRIASDKSFLASEALTACKALCGELCVCDATFSVLVPHSSSRHPSQQEAVGALIEEAINGLLKRGSEPPALTMPQILQLIPAVNNLLCGKKPNTKASARRSAALIASEYKAHQKACMGEAHVPFEVVCQALISNPVDRETFVTCANSDEAVKRADFSSPGISTSPRFASTHRLRRGAHTPSTTRRIATHLRGDRVVVGGPKVGGPPGVEDGPSGGHQSSRENPTERGRAEVREESQKGKGRPTSAPCSIRQRLECRARSRQPVREVSECNA
eukprot:GHVN01068708.1.p1 GENE.GHVN01068708.1~~GHVN01068708.1.p1  ORF type:complete len:506 (+),score=88.95 GHVN01068708.1:193-1710(+)